MNCCNCFRFRGDNLLSSGDKFKITADGGKHSLIISNVESSHGGKYTAKGSNDFGASRCTATLLVQGTQVHKFCIFVNFCIAWLAILLCDDICYYEEKKGTAGSQSAQV